MISRGEQIYRVGWSHSGFEHALISAGPVVEKHDVGADFDHVA